MAQKPVKTRFAPSPTGYLHVGGARTALFCWLFARHFGGSFILRIEDTDRERSTDEAVQAILDGMEWLGLKSDEGPFYQTEHFDRYKEVIQQLIATGHAYKCYCAKDRLDKLREEQIAQKIKPRYDGCCRDLNEERDEPYVIRFKNPQAGDVVFNDMVLGEIKVSNQELDDLIIARTDGTPTYNLTVVVDDADMEISHVIRGSDHINNTPRQINIFKALNLEVPVYAHVPMILGPDGKKLSKRHGAVSVMQYCYDGILPDALNNYLLRLGWSHGDQEIFTRKEMIQFFDGSSLNKSAAMFSQEKLLWLNQHYQKTLDPHFVAPAFIDQLNDLDIDVSGGPDVNEVIKLQAERTKDLKEMAERSKYFYSDVNQYDEKAAKKNLQNGIADPLQKLMESFSALDKWDKEKLHELLISTAEACDLKLGKLAQPVRVAVTGGTISPPLDSTLFLIGRDRVLARLDKAIHYAKGQV